MMEPNPFPILVVDDDREFLAHARQALEATGFEVRCASSAVQASAHLIAERFSVILADMVLPESTGLDILDEAKRREPLSVGILMTNYASTESAIQALRMGAYDYVLKPCEADILAASVKRAAEHHRLNVSLLHKTAQLEKLQLQLNDKARMIQNVSHELKNPLSVVYGYAAMLLNSGDEVDANETRRSLRSIFNNAERLEHLLEELLESTRLSGHKIELRREPVPVGRLCAETVENFQPEAARRGIVLELDCSCPEQRARADDRRAHQILSNLMTNALKFTPSGGRVTVRAREEDGSAVFSVTDTGCGIPSHDLPHLFERFYQSEKTKNDHKGLGLGLEICKGLVELHGGRIWAESAPGRGSAFYFTLPLAPASSSSRIVPELQREDAGDRRQQPA